MRLVRLLTSVLASGALLAIACGGDSDDSTPEPAADTASIGVTREATSASGAGAATVAATQSGGAGGSAGTSAKLPEDACKLLTKADLDTLSPTIGEGEATRDAGGGIAASVGCTWEWQDPSQLLGFYDVEVRVLSLPTTIPAAQARTGMQVELRDAGANGAEVPGVGDYAVFISIINGSAEGRALIKNLILEVEISGPNARQQKDKAIALLRAAASRL